MKRTVALLLALTFLLAGCEWNVQQKTTNPDSGVGSNNQAGGESGNADPVAVDFSQTDADMFTDRDRKADYEEAKAIKIQLNGTSAAASSGSVQIQGSKVIITQEGTYLLSGNLTDGMIIVETADSDKVQLVLAGVDITSKTSAALYIRNADKVFLTLADGTSNALTGGDSFTAIDDTNIDGVLFSKDDLTINGAGELTVTSPAGHGIVCKDDLAITGGTFVIRCASHGLDANNSVRIKGADLTVDAGKDAIHCENGGDAAKGFVYISDGNIKAEAEGDGISSSAYMQINSGTIDLMIGGGSKNGNKTHSDGFGGFGGFGGGKPGGKPGSNTSTAESGTSMKGLKAGNSLLIASGTIIINSADDSIHSNVSVIINGGTFALASGDDAVHAEDTLTVTACKMDISECYEGLEAQHIHVRGGDIKMVASDDGLNAAGGTDQSGGGGRDGMFGGGRPGGMSGNSNGSIKVSGGTLYIQSSGDSMDANGTLEISGGHTTVVGPIQGDTAVLDYDKTGVITGGTFIGTGSTMMAQSFSDSNQGVIALKVGNRAAGTEILLKDSTGKVILSRTPELDFALVILSSPEMVKGGTYTVIIGSDSKNFKAN